MLADENDGLDDLGRKGRKGRRPVYVAPYAAYPVDTAVATPGCVQINLSDSVLMNKYRAIGYSMHLASSPTGTIVWACPPGMLPMTAAPAVMPVMLAPPPMPAWGSALPQAEPTAVPEGNVMGLDEGLF